tara:strand:- start:76 stop:717 length:642 start_codon:yes stop_codon:yes gene_type:complete
MFKTCFLINSPGEPFKFKGLDAEKAILSVFPDINGYAQTRALPSEDPPPFSGFAELWFNDSSIAIRACSLGVGSLLSDGVEVQSCLVGMERVVMRMPKNATEKRVKGVYPFRKRAGLDLASFHRYWWHTHGPIAALTEQALSYVQIHTLASSYPTVKPEFDGITEITWTDMEAAGRAISSRQMREDQGGDAPNFVDMESIKLFMAKEEVIIDP